MSEEQVTIGASSIFKAKQAMELLMAENKDLQTKVASTRLSRAAAARIAEAAIALGEIRPVEKAAAVEAFIQNPTAVVDLLTKVAHDHSRSVDALGGPAQVNTSNPSTSVDYKAQADALWEAEFGS